MAPTERSFVLTLAFDPDTHERLDGLRRAHFPPELNRVPAHLTLFHKLVGKVEAPIRAAAAARGPIPLRFYRVHRLGRGSAYGVDAPELSRLHSELASVFEGQLTAQDRQPYRPHVTLQNKADPEAARALYADLSETFSPWEGTGTGLILWQYLGGPWEKQCEIPFAVEDPFSTFTEWGEPADCGAYARLKEPD